MKITKFLPIAYLSTTILFASCAKQSDPVIVLKGSPEMTIYEGETFNDPGATATDYKGRDISSDIEVSGTVGATSGHYTLDYTVTDKKGNFSRVGRGVTRGFKNSNLAGTYSVTEVSTNGGGTQTYTGTIAAGSGDIVSVTLDNRNSVHVPIIMDAKITSTATQIDVLDQTKNGITISNGSFGFLSNTSGKTVITISYQSFNGMMTRNHDATWTKQ